MQEQQNKYFLSFAVISVNTLSFSAAAAFSWASPVVPKLASSDPEINPLDEPTTTFEEAVVASILHAASLISALTSGYVAEALGRRKTLIILGLPMLIGYAIMSFATKISLFYVARFLSGITVGAVHSVLPSYVAEISEDGNRGILGGVMGIAVASGQLFSYAVGPFLSVKMFSICQLVPLVLFYLSYLPFVPESPYHLLAVGEDNKTEECLKKLRGKQLCDVQKELLFIKERVKESQTNKMQLTDTFKSKAFVRGLVICCGLMFFQQGSGICAVVAYMQTIFDASGSEIPAYIAPIPVAFIQLICNFIIIFLVDRLGRKPLLLLSAVGISIGLISLGSYFFLHSDPLDKETVSLVPIYSLVLFIASFNMGFSSLPWTICAEVFSPNVKSLGSSISACFCLTIAFLMTLLFPYISLALDMSGTFWLFGAVVVLSIVFIVLVLPETKGISCLRIQEILEGKIEMNVSTEIPESSDR